jgi:UDP-N-acetylglucosamine transferase subunit ALG13
VIFVTVGTHHQPFDRLLCALGPLAELDRLVVQHGVGRAPACADIAVDFLSAREVATRVEQARAVVMHAGVGSFLVAYRAGHVPVMVPRQRRYGEHVDDHQTSLVRALEREGRVRAVWHVEELADAVEGASRRAAPEAPAAGESLQAAVRRAMDGERIADSPLLPSRRRWSYRAGLLRRTSPRPHYGHHDVRGPATPLA